MTQIASGWYSDPKGSGQLRYWDGLAWTEHLRPPAAPVTMPPPVMAPPFAEARPDPYDFRQIPTETNGGHGVITQGSPKLVGIFLIVFGLIFAFSGLGSIGVAVFTSSIFGGYSSAGPGAVETTGRVVDLQSQGVDCAPIATFTVDGVEHQALSLVTYSPCNTAIGREVTVSYLAGDPANSGVIASDADALTAGVSGVFIGGGVLFGVIGILIVMLGVSMLRKIVK